ncbi:TPA: ribosome biogenesis protein [Candidatus Micrarchaeota archaeon]|nr:ribosome biogenesis protein [Candidatus Micrarchaeota archaeon]
MKKMMLCTACSGYTLAAEHCNSPTVSAHPPPFKPDDRYGSYRRKWKKGSSK